MSINPAQPPLPNTTIEFPPWQRRWASNHGNRSEGKEADLTTGGDGRWISLGFSDIGP